jgi:hypothetical protein
MLTVCGSCTKTGRTAFLSHTNRSGRQLQSRSLLSSDRPVNVFIRGRTLMCVESSVRLAIMHFETEGSIGLVGSQVILEADAE